MCKNQKDGHFICNNRRAKSQKYERYTGNFPQLPVYTGTPVFLQGTWAHCPLPQMQILPLPKKVPCDQDATIMVQNLYSERELSIKL